MYKACIFDLDGTLADTLESITYSVNKTLHTLGLRQITREQCQSFIGNGARRLIEQSLQVAGDPEIRLIEEAMDVYGRVFNKYCTYHVVPYDGIIELLQELKNMNIQLTVLSNKPHLQTKDVVSEFFDDGTFTRVYGQQESVPRKPDPAGVNIILEDLKISKEECLYIGDSNVDMQTGCAAGVTTVGVSWGFQGRKVLTEHGANYVVDKPEEIISIIKGVE